MKHFIRRLGRALGTTAVLTIVLLAFRFGADTASRFGADVGAASAYVTAVGTLYSILAAFTIFVVWTQFNDTETAIAEESKDLVDLYRYVKYLRDPAADSQFKAAILAYARAVIDDEWAKMGAGLRSTVATEAFESVFAAAGAVKFDDERDEAAWGMIIRKFEDVSDSRHKRLSLAGTRIPPLLKTLLVSASFALVAGFFMLAIENNFLAVGLTALPTALVVLVIDAVWDIDDPFGGHWTLEPTPFEEASHAIVEIGAGGSDLVSTTSLGA